MKKVSIKKFKPEQKTSKIKTEQSEKLNKNQKTKIQKIRFSCIEMKREQNLNNPVQLNKVRKSNFSQINQISNQENLLRNMMESNERKRFQLLNNLIKTKRKLFRSSSKRDQSFKKMIKIKTQEKQNYFQTKIERQKIFSKAYDPKTSKYSNELCISQRKKPMTKLSPRESQLLKNSFNKRIKEIKLRKYFQKDELQTNPINLLQAYGASLMGDKHSENQDSVYFSQGIYVLCDGHGSNGKQISSFVAQAVHNSLSQYQQQHKIDEAIILESYRKIDLELQNSNFDISFSGCTCVALLRHENTLQCINLGDSRAIMCKGYSVVQISKTHKPDKPQEKERIQNYGGVVKQSQISKDKFVGPMRLWAPGKNSWGPGLALSRAFGDKAARRYGLISVPQVTQIKLTSDEEFIIIGSDGLFDYFPDQQICQFVRKLLRDQSISKQQIPDQLVNEAKKKWPDGSDDISCIIIFI